MKGRQLASSLLLAAALGYALALVYLRAIGALC